MSERFENKRDLPQFVWHKVLVITTQSNHWRNQDEEAFLKTQWCPLGFLGTKQDPEIQLYSSGNHWTLLACDNQPEVRILHWFNETSNLLALR